MALEAARLDMERRDKRPKEEERMDEEQEKAETGLDPILLDDCTGDTGESKTDAPGALMLQGPVYK